MEKVYKGFAGWKQEDEKHAATHRLLTNEEYEGLQDTIRSLKNRLSASRQATQDAQEQARRDVSRVKSDANDKIQEWKDYAAAEQEKRQAAEALNVNLKRICKENANAKRGLRPKKSHSGYVARKSQQTVRVTYNGRKRQETPVWRTTIESPYNVILTEEQARAEISADIHEKGVLRFSGSYYTDWKMFKDMKSGLWCFDLETENEFLGVA